MLVNLTVCSAFLIALAGLATAAANGNHEEAAGQQQQQSDLPAQISTGKRSKRDSLSPGFYGGAAAEAADDEGSLSRLNAPLPPALGDADVVTDIFNDPAVLQALYDSARYEDDRLSKDSDDDGDDNDDDGDDDGLITFPYTPIGDQDMPADDEDHDVNSEGSDEKRARLFVGKRARLFVGKRPRLFVGKRRLFVGKRRLFVGKRRLFVGKRQRLFVGKRPRLFVGKRQRLFVGKRPRLFVGKRQRLFVGKRDWQANVQRRLQEFLEQRERLRNAFPKRYRSLQGNGFGFLGDFQTDKRPSRMFVGKRDDISDMMHRVGDLVDKRARLFVGKREQELVNGADFEDGNMDTKRSSRMFVGKRRAGSSPYDLMEKRHRYFVGKRAGVFESDGDKDVDLGSTDGDASPAVDESLQGLKRSREFVGRR